MVDAKQCDRCDQYYNIDAERKDKIYVIEMPTEPEAKDLCPDCQAEIDEWWDSGLGESTQKTVAKNKEKPKAKKTDDIPQFKIKRLADIIRERYPELTKNKATRYARELIELYPDARSVKNISLTRVRKDLEGNPEEEHVPEKKPESKYRCIMCNKEPVQNSGEWCDACEKNFTKGANNV